MAGRQGQVENLGIKQNSRFDFHPTPLEGLWVVQRKAIEDQRGFLSRLYCAEEFREAGIDKPITQINQTFTTMKGAVRGLHFQHFPHAETKLVTCINGKIFDVAVDLRRNSPTFLQWHSEVLSSANRRSLFIPEGYAHGFQTLTENCELIYLHTATYQPDAEGGIRYNDPAVNISWPLRATYVSQRDASHPLLSNNFVGVLI
jgi:dTDP-4-dehydrorhamnose 3,5-epimerase